MYRRAEDVRVLAVVIAELELRHIQRKVFGGNLMVCADNAALQDGPETLNRIGMDGADNVLATAMVNRTVRIGLAQITICTVLIGAKQADFLGHALADESRKGRSVGVTDHAGDHVTLTGNSTSHDLFARAATAVRAVATLVFVPVLRFAANVGFIHLHDAHQASELLVSKTSADAHAHVVCRPIGAKAHHTLDLEGGNSLFADQHQVDDAEPHPQINVRVLENGPDKVREAVGGADAAVHALPFVSHGLQFNHMKRAAAGAIHRLGPTFLDQVSIASGFVREHLFKLRYGELFDAGHGFYPTMIGQN